MEQKPRKRRGALIFSMVFLAVAGGIVATVLLANDRRNLRIVLREMGYETRTMVIPKPGTMEKFKGKRIEGVAVQVPGQAFLPPVRNGESAFLRSLAMKDGEGLCRMLRRHGFDMSTWEGGAFARGVLECSYESTIANADKPGDPSTFFMMVKGSAGGDLISARAKIIVTSRNAQAELATRAADALKVFAMHTHWLDLAGGLKKVAALEPFEISSHGMTVRFKSEFSGPGRYNLILSVTAPLTPAQRRTRDYFDRKRNWTLLPEHGGPHAQAKDEAVEG